MNDRTYRIVLLQALTYVVTGAFFVAGSLLPKSLTGLEPIQTGFFACTSVLSISVLWIWRRYVRWTGIRTMSTTALTVLLFAQVILWQPILTSTNCIITEMIPPAQSSSMAGLWCLGCCLLWWVPIQSLSSSKSLSRSSFGGNIMSPDATRLAIGGALIPLLPGILFLSFCLIHIFSDGEIKDTGLSWEAYQVSTLFALLFWVGLWKNRVIWSTRCKWITAALAVLLLLSPLGVFLYEPNSPSGSNWSNEFFFTIAYTIPLFAGAAWFGGTARVWRATPSLLANQADAGSASGSVAAHCPQCSYNLRGLREVRCPECGWASTVDDIVNRSLAEQIALSGGSV